MVAQERTVLVTPDGRTAVAQTKNGLPPEIVVLGTTPPPVTGMTLLTERVVRGLQQAGRVTIFDWSTGILRRGLKFRAARVLRILRSLVWLLWHGRVRNARLYTVANSKAGLYLTAMVVWLARRLGYVVYLHHHTYYYIDHYDWRVAWIDRMLGSHGGIHVLHTRQMADDFRAMYPTACPFAFVYPSVVSAPIERPRASLATPIRLGHLSNLSVAKGLDFVLETFRALRRSGRPVHLTLAGAFLTKEARRIVQQAVKEHDSLVEYLGPVYGDGKTDFFQRIDCFLFPSRSESWGIVLHEAMAAGVPVITSDRGCTRTVVGEKAGLVIEPGADFPQVAAQQVEHWLNHIDSYRMASEAAIEQAECLQREGQRTLDEFVAHLFSCAQSADGLYRPA